MNTNVMFIKVVVAFVMLSSYSVVFASNNTSKIFKDAECQTVINGENISKYIINTDIETLNNSDIKISSSTGESMISIENSNTKKIVKYDQDVMWCDYQALFDKTKSVVLEENTNIKVEHTNFETNTLARTVLGIANKNCLVIADALNGIDTAQMSLLSKMCKYLDNNYINNTNNDCNTAAKQYLDKSFYIVYYNYICLLAIIASSECFGVAKQNYLDLVKDVLQIGKCEIKSMQYYDVVQPLLNTLL